MIITQKKTRTKQNQEKPRNRQENPQKQWRELSDQLTIHSLAAANMNIVIVRPGSKWKGRGRNHIFPNGKFEVIHFKLKRRTKSTTRAESLQRNGA